MRSPRGVRYKDPLWTIGEDFVQALNNITRWQMRQDGFARRIMPPERVHPADLMPRSKRGRR
jgi:hypothetical protein